MASLLCSILASIFAAATTNRISEGLERTKMRMTHACTPAWIGYQLTIDRNSNSAVNEVAIPHLRHTTAAVRSFEEYANIDPAVQSDIAQAIFAAARFPGLKWKKTALEEASSIISTLQCSHLQACLDELRS